MPSPAIALKLKRFRGRFGISARRVVVRSYVPWPWGLLAVVLLLLLLGLSVWLMAQKNEVAFWDGELGGLRQQLRVQADELNHLRSIVGTGQNAVSIERAAQHQLLGRIQRLEAENALLKEEALLFERLIPAVGEVASIRVENFRVFKESEGRFRYRALFTFQSDKKIAEFRGRLQISVDYTVSGKVFQLLLPDRRESESNFLIEVKHVLRREGGFELPLGAVVQGAEVRVLQGEAVKVKRLAQL
jgi:hypothetical protein